MLQIKETYSSKQFYIFMTYKLDWSSSEDRHIANLLNIEFKKYKKLTKEYSGYTSSKFIFFAKEHRLKNFIEDYVIKYLLFKL